MRVELGEVQSHYGVVTMCIGDGQGAAGLFDRTNGFSCETVSARRVMAALSHSVQCHSGGRFLIANSTPEEVFTREDLSAAQKMLGSVAEDFMRTEVFPRSEQLDAKDHSVTRDMLQKAGELDLLSLDVPQEYGGLGLDKVSSAHVFEKIGTRLRSEWRLWPTPGSGRCPSSISEPSSRNHATCRISRAAKKSAPMRSPSRVRVPTHSPSAQKPS